MNKFHEKSKSTDFKEKKYRESKKEEISYEEVKKILTKKISFDSKFPEFFQILEGLDSPLIVETCNDIMKKSTDIQPEIAVGCIISFLSAVIGRRYKVFFYNTYPNIYVTSLIGSGEGKSFAPKYMTALFNMIGLDCFIGSNGIRSAEGLRDELFEQQSQVKFMDEHGMELGKLKTGQSPHFIGIIKEKTMLYDKSGTILKIPKKAGETGEARKVPFPSLSIYATSTEVSYKNALSSKDFLTGELNREVLFFPIQDMPRFIPLESRMQKTDSGLPSQKIIDMWKNFKQKVLGSDMYDFNYNAIDFEKTPCIAVKFPVEETSIVEILWREQRKGYEQHQERIGEIYVRGHENTLKIALIIAVSRAVAQENIEIKRDDLSYGYMINLNSCKKMEQFALDAEEKTQRPTLYGEMKEKIIKHLKKRRQSDRQTIGKSIRNLPSDLREKILSDMIGNTEIIFDGRFFSLTD